ncbi:hypothetical protein FH609_011715 [Streptomyces sp. 3MP-14]|uniref:Minor tail T domain-containing protein n=1 Tax=Streptomyces mimosae TaxID=2586635 RepID=A0A5N6AFW7_9ACTN|nr:MULTISPECIES: hypothetical protein [Streptomyces]KAB8167062.1 hypothetical protein FH607_009165 [Streptomyces mimosae]KAB8177003.1 hypothetical protein FH609_011715 [Streptomyces sp. 3MP-14]
MLATTTSAELTEWMAYERVTGPLGPERGDALHGIQTAALVNAQKGKRGKRARPQDFIPTWDSGGGEQTPDEQLMQAVSITAAFGGTDTRTR